MRCARAQHNRGLCKPMSRTADTLEVPGSFALVVGLALVLPFLGSVLHAWRRWRRLQRPRRFRACSFVVTGSDAASVEARGLRACTRRTA
jgi:hypothetical protein